MVIVIYGYSNAEKHLISLGYWDITSIMVNYGELNVELHFQVGPSTIDCG